MTIEEEDDLYGAPAASTLPSAHCRNLPRQDSRSIENPWGSQREIPLFAMPANNPFELESALEDDDVPSEPRNRQATTARGFGPAHAAQVPFAASVPAHVPHLVPQAVSEREQDGNWWYDRTSFHRTRAMDRLNGIEPPDTPAWLQHPDDENEETGVYGIPLKAWFRGGLHRWLKREFRGAPIPIPAFLRHRRFNSDGELCPSDEDEADHSFSRPESRVRPSFESFTPSQAEAAGKQTVEQPAPVRVQSGRTRKQERLRRAVNRLLPTKTGADEDRSEPSTASHGKKNEDGSGEQRRVSASKRKVLGTFKSVKDLRTHFERKGGKESDDDEKAV